MHSGRTRAQLILIIAFAVAISMLLACGPTASPGAASPSRRTPATPDGAFGSTYVEAYFGMDEVHNREFFDHVGTVSFSDRPYNYRDCSTTGAIAYFESEARRTGATTFRLVRSSPPDSWSVCFRGEAELLIRNQRPWPSVLIAEESAREHLGRESGNLDLIEGIWVEAQGRDRLFIQRSDDGSLLAVTLSATQRLWRPGMIRSQLQPTAGLAYPGTFWSSWLTGYSTTAVLDPTGTSLTFTYTVNDGIFRFIPETVTTTYLLQYPPARTDARAGAAPGAQATFGSGVLLSPDGVIGTAAHVVMGAAEVLIAVDGVEYKATVLAVDSANDVALVQAHGLQVDFDLLPIGDDSALRLGDRVATIGFPLAARLGERPTYTEGSVSSLSAGFVDDARLLQVSAPIQPGNSGGPLFNAKGEIVGIVMATLDPLWAIQNRGAIPQNMNFAVRISYLVNLARIRGIRLAEQPAPQGAELTGANLADIGGHVAVQVHRLRVE